MAAKNVDSTPETYREFLTVDISKCDAAILATVRFPSEDLVPPEDLLGEMVTRLKWLYARGIYNNKHPALSNFFVENPDDKRYVTFGRYYNIDGCGGSFQGWEFDNQRRVVETMMKASEIRDSDWEITSVRYQDYTRSR